MSLKVFAMPYDFATSFAAGSERSQIQSTVTSGMLTSTGRCAPDVTTPAPMIPMDVRAGLLLMPAIEATQVPRLPCFQRCFVPARSLMSRLEGDFPRLWASDFGKVRFRDASDWSCGLSASFRGAAKLSMKVKGCRRHEVGDRRHTRHIDFDEIGI